MQPKVPKCAEGGQRACGLVTVTTRRPWGVGSRPKSMHVEEW
jgi:hypothetical protein